MAATFVKAGSFTLNSVTGNQQITGIGFLPKLVIMWAYQVIVQGGGNEVRSCFGAATSSTQRWASAMSHRGTSGYRSSQFRTNVLLFWNDALSDTEQMALSLVSMDNDGFTISVANGEPNVTINYMVVGGADVLAKVGTFNSPTLVGSQTVTGIGFEPKALIAMTGPYNTNDTPNVNAYHCLGIATSTSKYFSQAFAFLNDGLSQAYSKMGSDRRFIEQIDGDGVALARATVTTMTADSAPPYLEADPVGAWDDTSRFMVGGLAPSMGIETAISSIPNAQGKVIYLSSATSNTVVYPLSLVLTTGVSITNVNFRGRARQTQRYLGTETWKCVSLRFRDANDGSNYYNLKFGPFGWELKKRISGSDTVISSGTQVKNILGNWFPFIVEHNASSGLITITLDGTKVYSGIDTSLLSGANGFAIEYGEMEFDLVTGNVTDDMESYAVGTRPQYTTVGSWLGAWMSNGEPGAVWGVRSGGIVGLLGNSEDGLTNLTRVSDPVAGSSRSAFRFRVAQRDAVTYSTAQGSSTAPPTGLSVLTDNFDDNSTDTAKWSIGTIVSGGNPGSTTVTETGGALSIALPTGVALTYSGYLSVNTYNLTGSGAFVRVAQTPTTPGWIETFLFVGIDNSNGMFLLQSGGTLYFQYKVSGTTTTLGTVTYNASTHSWWRIREANGTIYWDTAPASTETARDPFLQPFAVTSIWNTPIGSGATYAAAGLTGTPRPGEWTQMPYGDDDHIVMKPSAPMTALNYSSVAWGGGNRCTATGSLMTTVPLPSSYVVPNNNGNDSLSSVLADGVTLVEGQPFSRCTAGAAGTITFVAGTTSSLTGDGILGGRGGSGMSVLGGTLRIGELRPGQTGPKHALKVNVYAKQALFKATTGAEAYRWPAAHGDSYAVGWYGTEATGGSSAGNNTNTNMKMGALLAIAASVNITALGLETEPGRQLAWTLQNYGAYIVDDTYAPGFAFSTEDSPDGNFRAQFQSDYGYTFNQNEISTDTAWRRDVKRLIQALSVVTNNTSSTIGGGGTPRQPLAASLSGVDNPPAESQWVNRASVATPITITSVKAHLAAGCYGSLSSASTILYDGFNTSNAAASKTKRTELMWPGLDKGLSIGTAYWHAFRINVGTSIRNAASTESVVLFQHQDGSGIERTVHPLSLYATGGTASAKLQIKTAWLDGGSTPTQTTVYDATYSADTWITFVIKVKPSYQLSDTPYLKVWRDGTLVVDDLLRNDFNNGQVTYGAKRSFVRFGIMHPDDTQWAAGDSRDVYHKGLVTMVDDGVITEASMRNLIENVVGNPTASSGDGWTMYWDTVAASAGKVGYVALGGTAKYDAHILTKPTVTGPQTNTISGFEPSGMLFGSIGTPVSAAASQHIKWSIGAAGAGLTEASSGFYQPDNSSSVSMPVVTNSSSKGLVIPGTTNGTTLAEMDVTSLNPEGYTVNWTKVDPVAAEVMVLMIGASTVMRSAALAKTTISASLTASIRMSSSVAAKTTITAPLVAPGSGLRANVAAKTTLTADLTISPRMAAAALAKTTASASLTTGIRLAAALTGKTTIAADLFIVPGNFRASATTRTTVAANLTTVIKLEAALSGKTTVSASLTTSVPMSAAAVCKTTVLASLTAPSDVISTLSFSDWLESDTAHRCVLVEAAPKVGGVSTNRYLSSKAYATSKYETPASTHYEALLTGGIKVTERLSIDGINSGSAGMSFGDIEIHNFNGELDSWLNDVWTNTPVKVYVGDVTWPRSKFQKVFDGLASDLDSKSRNLLNIKVRDKLDRLNNPAYEVKLGGTTVNKDKVPPLSLGEIHNMTPLLTDPATHTYRIHPTTIEDIIEVRDNGIPVSITKNTPDGTFSLLAHPSGTITASVQGDKTGGIYVNDIANIVLRLVRLYGRTEYRFLDSEIDYANFNAFGAANTMPVGAPVDGHSNILQICQNFLSSIGAQLTVSRVGMLQIKKVDFTLASTFSITPEDMLEKRLEIAARSTVIAADKVGFCRNWTVQSDLQTGIVEEHKAMYAEEWLTETAIDTNVANTYKLNTEPQQRDTMLLRRTDATAEANRRLNILKVPRTTYRFDGLPRMLQLTVGQNVTLTHPRFGLSAGVVGVVTSLSPDWGTCRVQVEVTV